jgi:RNA polymerase sigma-54 factor
LETEEEELIADQLLGSIDDDGYLRRAITSVRDDLMFAHNIFVEEPDIERILRQIQDFDPPGLGGRNLQECLLIQLRQKLDKEEYNWEHEESVELAIQILDNYFDEFSKKHYSKLTQKLDISEDDLKAAIDEILKLNPKPASGFASTGTSRNTQYVVPDFIIHNRDGELELTLNSRNAPSLHVSDHYQDMLKSYRKSDRNRSQQEKEAMTFVKQKIDSARWFIDAIRQRQQTMYKTMYTILQYQYDYFLTGNQKKLRPMILKDIADITGLDISTISRVVNSKYVQTEFGTKLLKDFFSESLQNEEGDEVSTLEVKKTLQEIVANENKRKPLSDQKLMNALKEKGYNIARRTVAKYREQLDIPVARLRKEL